MNNKKNTSQALMPLNNKIIYSVQDPHLSATARSRSGRNVFSVSMYIALPSPPPMSIGSYTMKQNITVGISLIYIYIMLQMTYIGLNYPYFHMSCILYNNT